MLGAIQSDRAVIPLMAALNSSTDEHVRVAAAWSLCRIGDARGVYAVKMATKFDDSNKVQARCAWYYETMVEPGTFTFIQTNGELVASAE
jgi:HEAT repeat protein